MSSNSEAEAVVREALRTVKDPEVGLNIVDVGLLRAVRVSPEAIHIDLTMTSRACPLGEMIRAQARAAVAERVPPTTAVTVDLVWDPPWEPSMMSDEARRRLGWT